MNFTYTAADARAGLVPFLNKVARSPPSRTLLVNLPAGTVWRGRGALRVPSGLSITLRGHGKDGAGNTTLNLQQQNLDLGAMLGDAGRMEFNGIHLTNVRPLLARLCALCVTLLCAQGYSVHLLLALTKCGRRAVQCRFVYCFGCCSVGSIALCWLTALDPTGRTRTLAISRGLIIIIGKHCSDKSESAAHRWHNITARNNAADDAGDS